MALSTIPGAVGALVWNKTVTFTDAQLKSAALITTGLEIVSAPGAGRMMQFLSATLVTHFVNAYTGFSDTDSLALWIGNLNASSYLPDLASASATALTDILAIGDNTVNLIPFSYGTNANLYVGAYGLLPRVGLTSDQENMNMTLFLETSGSGLTGGNAANTMMATVFYRLIEL